MTGTRLAPKGAELGGCIQDPSHILIGLGPCLGRGWKVGGLGAMLGAWRRKVQPKIHRESEGQRKVEGLTHVVLGRNDEGQHQVQGLC